MAADRYTVRIAGTTLADDVPYGEVLRSVVRYTVEAAVARAADRYDWEHEELRRRGLAAFEIARNGRALWCEPGDFATERALAGAQGAGTAFDAANELDSGFCQRLDADLRELWRKAGYETPSLAADMRPLFAELESDAQDRAASARSGLVLEIVEAVK